MKKIILVSIQSFQPIIRLSAQMCDRNNPDSIRLFKIYDAKRKPFHLPTSRAEFSHPAKFGICLNVRQRPAGGIEKIFPKKFAALFVKPRRLDEFIFGEPVIGNGFHAMRAGLSSSLRRPECLWLCPIRLDRKSTRLNSSH